MKKYIITLITLLLILNSLESANRRLRSTFRTDPSTTISIGWDQYSGNSPVLYYGTVDNGTNWNLYPFQSSPAVTNTDGGMNNTFVRLSGLTPNTVYYFVIKDSQGTGARYSFQTISTDSSQPLSLICGADTRAGIATRIIGFKLVAKLRPQAVIFTGDLTDSSSNSELQDWFDNWTFSIATDGRITPIIMAEGNHEYGIINISNLFDTPYIGSNVQNNYYSLPFGGSLLRVYNLNSFVDFTTETAWLQGQLQNYGNATSWNLPQYHLPVRPIVSTKANDQDEYNQWVPLFEQYNVKLVQEADAHVFSMTWPVKSSNSAGNDQGFVRDDVNGIVYFGEGGWGAPLYAADNPKSWTRGYESVFHFMLVHFYPNKVDIYTIRFENEPNVPVLTDANRLDTPSQLSLEPLIDRNGINSGDHVTISKAITSVPENFDSGSIAIFPTFVDNILNIQFNNPSTGSNIKIFDLSGQDLSTLNMPSSGNLQLNMDNFSKGIYIVEVQNNNQMKAFKIIKK
jgi:hypothetical protein